MEDLMHANLHKGLKQYFGFDKFIGEQEAIICNLMKGKDTFVLMPTGGGKSLCYQLPALLMEGTAIIVSPLIALMKNQVDNMRTFVIEDGIAHFLNSSLKRFEIQQVKDDVLSGKTKMLYVAPETLTKEENIEFFLKMKISFYAIDEAHCISEWGHDFRPEYRRIRPLVNTVGKAPIIALTATATPKVQLDIQKNLDMLDATVFKSSFNRSNLYYEVRPKVNAVKEIVKYIRANSGKSGIVYCLSRKGVEELAELLRINGIKALPYHAGMDKALRAVHQDKFLMEEVDVIVATIAFGMGIDKPDVRFVIHYDLPKSLEGYYQETGRSGRDHGEGQCIAFYSQKDVNRMLRLSRKNASVMEQEVAKLQILEAAAYAESAVCRRKLLLNYFGEDYEQNNCGSCDNCLNPKVQFEGKGYVLLLLETVEAIGEQFKPEYVVDVLLGRQSALIKSYKHNELDMYGEGDEKDERFWSTIIRQCYIQKLLTKGVEPYGVLALTEAGRDFIHHPHSIMLTENHNYAGEGDEEGGMIGLAGRGLAASSDAELFALLKDLRLSESKRLGTQPFVIFSEPSLHDMAIQYPITIEELQACHGVGVGKAQRFGQPFVELIARYVEEKGIEREQDIRLRTLPGKSANKLAIIRYIDRKMDLEDIARAVNLRLDDLLTEIESIISAGTRLDIDYYIRQNVDEDRCEVLDYYFANEAKSDSVQEAVNALVDEDVTETEIRLARIKYMSENGN